MARKLRQFGFTRIRPLSGGLEAWIAAGLPVEGEETEAGLATGAGMLS